MKQLLIIMCVATVLFSSSCTQSTNSNKDKNFESDSITGTYVNPLLDYGPDPWAYYHKGTYYYMHTMVDSLVLWKLKMLRIFEMQLRKQSGSPDPSNAKSLGTEITRVNNKWYIHYAADDGNTDNHQLYVLEIPMKILL